MTVGVGSAAAAAIWRAGGTVEQYSAGLLTLTLVTGLGKCGEGLEAGVESKLL